MSDENKMSISEREAEEQFPHHLFSCMPQTLEDVQEAYILGREAELYEEQIEAAAKVLADWSDPCIDCFEGRCRHIANLMLEAARKAVM